MSFFENVKEAPPDPIFGLMRAFNNDPRSCKVNLIMGVYQTDDLKPLILNVVKQAERLLLETEKSKNYLSIDGLPEYVELVKQLAFGGPKERVYGAQTVGGTAALRVGARFLREQGFSKVYISDPSWPNHHRIFQHAGFQMESYPYFDEKKKAVNIEGFLAALNKMDEGQIVLFHASCHNPTGCDPSDEQWKRICAKMKERRLFPFFDCAYQGFGDGLEQDSAPLRLFLEEGFELAASISSSKNFGIYAERTGALYLACKDSSQAGRAGSCIKVIIRGMYSNPPCHGARIVSAILGNPTLKESWLKEVASMRERITIMRMALADQLRKGASSGPFDFLEAQKGMFSFTGLDKKQVERLIAEYGIYLPIDGRINVSGISRENLNYVAESILAVCN